MKSKYEISIWNDIPDEETGLFKEEKLIDLNYVYLE